MITLLHIYIYVYIMDGYTHLYWLFSEVFLCFLLPAVASFLHTTLYPPTEYIYRINSRRKLQLHKLINSKELKTVTA